MPVSTSGGYGSSTIVTKIDDSDLKAVGKALREVGDQTKTRILYRALNRAGDKSATQIKRVLAKETGLPVGRVGRALTKISASSGRLIYKIDAKGGYLKITAGNFKARQVRKGVSHGAWGRRQTAKGAFIPKGMSVAFKRLSKRRLPIKALYGPAIPREMVRGESRKVAPVMLKQVFVPEAMRQLDRELKAAAARHGL